MSVYNTGIILNPVPTGFGGYTGVVLVNNGNFPVIYTAKMSDTTITGLGVNTNTLYLSLYNNEVDINISELSQTVNPTESGIFYVLHKPYLSAITGYETANLSISTVSSLGDIDKEINIKISGHRAVDNPLPGIINNFYVIKDFSSNNLYNLNFYWNVLRPDTYVTGFNLEIATDSNFNTVIDTAFYNIPPNITNQYYPVYGNYNGFGDSQRSILIKNLQLGTDYYARIKGVNAEGEYGVISYPFGLTNTIPSLPNNVQNGLYPSPGDNLRLEPQILYINRADDTETDFDLFSFIKEKNNNSTDFRKYSGVYVKFSSSTPSLCKYVASSTTKGAINCVIPDGTDFRFNADANNKFTMILEFENVALLGYGGDGLRFNPDGSYTDPQKGGPFLKLDYYKYGNYELEYRIYKDLNSYFYAGVAGGKGWLITDDTTKALNENRVDGDKIEYLADYDLRGGP